MFPTTSSTQPSRGNVRKAFALACLLLLPRLCNAGQWDDLRQQWIKERKALTVADIPALREAVAKEDMRALFLLGTLPYSNELGVDVMATEGPMTEAACKKAEDGHPLALVWCGVAHRDGKWGQPKDMMRARSHFEAAAARGYGVAKARLAGLVANGEAGLQHDSAKAVSMYREAASEGDEFAVYTIGWAYEHGQLGLKPEAQQALLLYQQAADMGSTEAMRALAKAHGNGALGLPKDEVKALQAFRRAASLGDAQSMAFIGRFHQTGLAGLQPDSAAAGLWYSKAERFSEPWDLAMLGRELEISQLGEGGQVALAMPWYRKAAERGNTFAANRLSWWLRKGTTGVRQDADEANRWLAFSAAQGDADAMYRLATYLRDGLWGLPVDQPRAFSMFQACSAKGDLDCEVAVAHAYRKGLGTSQDYGLALVLFERAAERGSAYAMGAIGEMHYAGDGVPQSNKRSAAWYRKAAEAGSGIHMAMYADRLISGDGVSKDVAEGARWLSRALVLGHQTDSANGETASQRAKRVLDQMLAEGQITDPEVLAEVKKAFAPPPSVSWAGLRGVWTTEAVEIPYQLRDEGGGLGDVQLLVNGQVVDRQPATAQPASKGAVRSGRFQLKLSAGQYEVEVRAYGAENLGTFGSAKSILSSSWQRVGKPRLHLVVVGVDQFEAPELRLSYAASDARAVYALLSKQVGPLFDAGRMHLLTGRAETGKARIQQAVAQVVEQAESDDVFVFYAASHGFNYDSGGYHLLTADVASKQAAQVRPASLSHKELRDLFSQVRARKKLVLLDTCQAGRSLVADDLVGGSRGLGLKDDERELIDAMRTKSGATVLMASESEQLAYEGYKGHGLFTYTLLEALSQASAGQSGLISTDAVMSHVETRVPQLAREVFKAEQRTYASKAGTAFPLVKWP